MTNSEAAEYLKLSPRTLDRWRWSQRGPRFMKLGGAVRYTMADLEKFAGLAGDPK
ncbi:helix-turn-helix domain-containing protein [Sphingomonas sp. LB3N6]|uniref:helix-turn-helix domain-containing protein n=1 Tax=Sphingomonas fucosidasi TaxID=3096164 RepID=UPI003FA6DC51